LPLPLPFTRNRVVHQDLHSAVSSAASVSVLRDRRGKLKEKRKEEMELQKLEIIEINSINVLGA